MKSIIPLILTAGVLFAADLKPVSEATYPKMVASVLASLKDSTGVDITGILAAGGSPSGRS